MNALNFNPFDGSNGLPGLGSISTAKVNKDMQTKMKNDLNQSIKKLYGLSLDDPSQFINPSDLEQVILTINQSTGPSMGVCAKSMFPGMVAWRCMDCEKDPTCIICAECFEKGDHTGHRVQLKRNVGGCCDCGDPEAWDPDHFCSDHKGY